MKDLTLDRAGATEREAIELFAAWIEGAHAATRSGLCLVGAAVAAASGRLGLLAAVVAQARATGLRRVALEEALLQTYLFAGYPRAIEALTLLARAWPARTRATPIAREAWRSRGTRLCRRVYGGRYERMREGIRYAHPDLADWMIEEGYGKVLSRPGLGAVQRELCAVGVLAALAAPRQLRAHLRGALNAGAKPCEVAAAVRAAGLGCGIRTWRAARRIAVDELQGDGRG